MSPRGRRPGKPHGDLVKFQGYFYPDEMDALEDAAVRERCSRAELLRRALREYLGLDDG